MTIDEMNAKYGRPLTTASSKQDSSNPFGFKQPQPQERNILQKTAGFVLDPIAKLATEAGNLAGKGIVRGIEHFQTPEQKAITEANLQKALNTPSQVPSLGTEVKGLNDVTARDVAGQALEAAAMFAPGAGKGASLLAKTAIGAGTGFAMDVAQGLQNENKNLKQAFTPGLSTVVGTILPLAGAGINKLKDNIPKWFVEKNIPKLTNKAGSIDETLSKLSYGTVDKNLKTSASRVVDMGSNIDSILNKPENLSKKFGIDIIDNTVSFFPDSNYTQKHIISEIKKLIPSKAKILDKIINSTATPFEANQLKKELYKTTSKVFENIGTPPARKEIGAAFATTIADKIKGTIAETESIFKELAKEINLRNALIGTSKKVQAKAGLGLYDIAGYFAGGLPGLVGEKTINSPGVQIGIAKVVNKLGKSKSIPAVAGVAKKAVLKGASLINN